MCLVVDKRKHDEHRGAAIHAERDIIVYKVLFWDGDKWVSPYRLEPWNVKELVEVELGVEFPFYNEIVVNEGLHAYLDMETALKDVKGWHFFGGICFNIKCPEFVPESVSIFKTIIPEGSQYYLGCKDDIVSNKMLIVESVLVMETNHHEIKVPRK